MLLDLLMAVMNSLAIWQAAAGEARIGLAWRDEVTSLMHAGGRYLPYEELVAAGAAALQLPKSGPADLFARWSEMEPWPDADAIHRLSIPFAFLTNCSAALAGRAAARSGLSPAFTLSAEEAGYYKPHQRSYAAACDRLGLAPRQILYVAGAPYDAKGAATAGLRATLVVRRAEQALPGQGVRIARSLDDALASIG